MLIRSWTVENPDTGLLTGDDAVDSIDASDLALYVESMLFARVQGSMEWCCPFGVI